MNIQIDQWSELEPERKKVPTSAPVRFGISQFRGGLRRGRILVKRSVIDKLKMETWRVSVRAGKGANKYRLAVIPAKDGRFELNEVGLTKGGGTWRLQLPHMEDWTDYPLPMAEPVWTVEKLFGSTMALIIELPAPLVDHASFLQWKQARAG